MCEAVNLITAKYERLASENERLISDNTQLGDEIAISEHLRYHNHPSAEDDSARHDVESNKNSSQAVILALTDTITTMHTQISELKSAKLGLEESMKVRQAANEECLHRANALYTEISAENWKLRLNDQTEQESAVELTKLKE